MYDKALCCVAQLYVVYGAQHCMPMLFCIVESEIKVIHTNLHAILNC